jgi:outer membrane protein TolC
MIMFSSFVRFGRRMILGLLVLPIAALAQSSADLPPLAEDLLPELRPFLVSALGQSPQMILSNINIASAEAVRLQLYAGLWPNVSGAASYSASKATVAQQTNISSTSSGLYYSLGLSQPIFQWGAVKNRALSGTVGVKLSEHQYADAYRMLVVSLRTQFLALVGKKIALRNAEFALKQAEDGLARAEAQLKNGRISPEAMMEPRLGVDEARLARDRAVEDLEYSTRIFLLTVGQTNLGADQIPAEIPRPVYAPDVVTRLLQRFVQTGADGTYAALSYHDYLKMADIDYRITKVNLLPKLSFSAGFSQANVTSASLNSVSQVGVFSNYWNVVASWSIFDGFATRGAKRSVLLRKRSYESSLKSITTQALADARALEQRLGFAWRTSQISETRRNVSLTRAQRLQDDLSRGKASQTAVNSALLSTYYQDLALASARGDFLNNWSQFVSTLCVDPMLNLIPASYLKDDK